MFSFQRVLNLLVLFIIIGKPNYMLYICPTICKLFLQIERRQSELGKLRDLLTTNYSSPNKFEGCTSTEILSRYHI